MQGCARIDAGVLKAIRRVRLHGEKDEPSRPRMRRKEWLMSLTTQK
jgi:hypothetical protein